MIRALRRQSECNLWRSLGMSDDARKRGKRGRLSNGTCTSTERGRGVSLRRGVGSPAERGAQTRASSSRQRCRSPARDSIGFCHRCRPGDLRRPRAHRSTFAARARDGAERRRARSRHARDAARRAAQRCAERQSVAPEAEVFRSVLKAHPDERLTQSMLIDRDGRVVEYDGTEDASDLALAALAGRAKPPAASDIQGGRDPHPDRT